MLIFNAIYVLDRRHIQRYKRIGKMHLVSEQMQKYVDLKMEIEHQIIQDHIHFIDPINVFTISISCIGFKYQ